MRIIESSFEILDFDEDALDKIERAGRICYQSEPRGKASKFVANLRVMGHMTPFEMSDATVSIVCDRGCSHELVRHWLISANQSSTRYCNYANDKFGNEITMIKPPFWNENSVRTTAPIREN